MDGFAHLIIIGLGALIGYSAAKERRKKALQERSDGILDSFYDSDESSAANIKEKAPLSIPNKNDSSIKPER